MKKISFKSFYDLDEKQKNIIIDIYNENFCKSQWSKGYFDFYFNIDKRKTVSYFLVVEDKLIGFVWGKISEKNRKEFNISALWADKNYRNKGYGKLLMGKIIDYIFQNMNLEKAYLHFRDSNDLEDFYKNLGFSNHKIDEQYSNGEKKHYMEIKLRVKFKKYNHKLL